MAWLRMTAKEAYDWLAFESKLAPMVTTADTLLSSYKPQQEISCMHASKWCSTRVLNEATSASSCNYLEKDPAWPGGITEKLLSTIGGGNFACWIQTKCYLHRVLCETCESHLVLHPCNDRVLYHLPLPIRQQVRLPGCICLCTQLAGMR